MEYALLDTCVASLLMKNRASSKHSEFLEHQFASRRFAISFYTVAELWRWAEKNNWGQSRRNKLDLFIKQFLVLPYDYELVKVWAKVYTECEKIGRRLEAADSWIAATAVYRKIPLVTSDNDFRDLKVKGLTVLSLDNLS